MQPNHATCFARPSQSDVRPHCTWRARPPHSAPHAHPPPQATTPPPEPSKPPRWTQPLTRPPRASLNPTSCDATPSRPTAVTPTRSPAPPPSRAQHQHPNPCALGPADYPPRSLSRIAHRKRPPVPCLGAVRGIALTRAPGRRAWIEGSKRESCEGCERELLLSLPGRGAVFVARDLASRRTPPPRPDHFRVGQVAGGRGTGRRVRLGRSAGGGSVVGCGLGEAH